MRSFLLPRLPPDRDPYGPCAPRGACLPCGASGHSYKTVNATRLAQQLHATELLFQAVTDPDCLREAIAATAELLGAQAGVLVVGRPSGGSRRVVRVQPALESASPLATFAYFEPYRPAALARPPGVFYLTEDLLPRQQLEQSAFYSRFLRHAPPVAGCIAHVPVAAGEVCTVGFGRLHDGDSAAAPHFAPEALAAAEQLLPHLRRVCLLHHRLDAQQAASAALMGRYERYHVGVVVVDEEGGVAYTNAAATRLFEAEDGLLLRGGCLDLSHPEDSVALMGAIRESLSGVGPAAGTAPRLHRVMRAAGAPLSVAVSPYPGAAQARGYAVLMVYDPDRPPVERPGALRSAYQLSDRESDLACALSGGESLEAFASRSGRSLESVRSQLKRIYRKTGTTRQSELVKLVLTGPAALVH